MTYVREQTSAELAAHMRSLQAMPGWFDPLADRLWQEVQSLQRDNAALMEDAAAQIQIAREAAIRADAWRDFATHQTWCADCAESVASCPIGIRLQTVALEKERP